MVKHTQTIRRLLPTNCLSVFDYFVGLAHKGLGLDAPYVRLFYVDLVFPFLLYKQEFWVFYFFKLFNHKTMTFVK